mmetsp:Transcript_71436/g.207100  ORF Transcript_71436/g.207100 Transcript_71436/m.207100 type:complete len:157 (+) Transcript_71436:413-883(+)
MEYAPPEMLADRGFVREAVLRRGGSLKWASEDLRDDPHLVFEVVRAYPNALQFASSRLQANPLAEEGAIAASFTITRHDMNSADCCSDGWLHLCATEMSGRRVSVVLPHNALLVELAHALAPRAGRHMVRLVLPRTYFPEPADAMRPLEDFLRRAQ